MPETQPTPDLDDDGMGERWIWEPGDLDDEPAPNPTR